MTVVVVVTVVVAVVVVVVKTMEIQITTNHGFLLNFAWRTLAQ